MSSRWLRRRTGTPDQIGKPFPVLSGEREVGTLPVGQPQIIIRPPLMIQTPTGQPVSVITDISVPGNVPLGFKIERTLSPLENVGTDIVHARVGTVAKIVGSDESGFVVNVPKEGYTGILPFHKVEDWRVLSRV